jgi:hypothetical protein
VAGLLDHPDGGPVTGRAGLRVCAVVMVPTLMVGLLLWVLFFGAQSAQAACTPQTGPVDPTVIPDGAEVAGFGHTQLVNAAEIVNAAAALGLGGNAQLLGVQAAIGESTLTNLNHGDGAINPDGTIADSLGLFQQQSSWGTVGQRRDPATAATLFFTRLQTVVGWQQMIPTVAINTVQGNQNPDYYSRFAAPAAAVVHYLATLPTSTAPVNPSPAGTIASSSAPTVLATAQPTASPSPAASGAGAGVCGAISGDARTLAEGLLQQVKAGRLSLLEPRYEQEIVDVAAGTQSAACGLDPRTLQLIQLALRSFHTVGVSDLNRRCTGSLLGAGSQSSHWINGGGQAVDFYSFDGTPLTGGDPASMRFLHLVEFDDTCNHLHLDVAFTSGAPLTLSG